MTFGYVAACDDTWGDERMACRAHTTIRELVPSRATPDGLALAELLATEGWQLTIVDDHIVVRCPSHGRQLGPLVP